MSKRLIKRIMAEGTVDTRNYRYTTRGRWNCYGEYESEIIRIPLKSLGTTAAIDGWERVGVII